MDTPPRAEEWGAGQRDPESLWMVTKETAPVVVEGLPSSDNGVLAVMQKGAIVAAQRVLHRDDPARMQLVLEAPIPNGVIAVYTADGAAAVVPCKPRQNRLDELLFVSPSMPPSHPRSHTASPPPRRPTPTQQRSPPHRRRRPSSDAGVCKPVYEQAQSSPGFRVFASPYGVVGAPRRRKSLVWESMSPEKGGGSRVRDSHPLELCVGVAGFRKARAPSRSPSGCGVSSCERFEHLEAERQGRLAAVRREKERESAAAFASLPFRPVIKKSAWVKQPGDTPVHLRLCRPKPRNPPPDDVPKECTFSPSITPVPGRSTAVADSESITARLASDVARRQQRAKDRETQRKKLENELCHPARAHTSPRGGGGGGADWARLARPSAREPGGGGAQAAGRMLEKGETASMVARLHAPRPSHAAPAYPAAVHTSPARRMRRPRARAQPAVQQDAPRSNPTHGVPHTDSTPSEVDEWSGSTECCDTHDQPELPAKSSPRLSHDGVSSPEQQLSSIHRAGVDSLEPVSALWSSALIDLSQPVDSSAQVSLAHVALAECVRPFLF
ncbi:hypothetical protein DIPPA_06998 [Diplonema papillatum]|nr:hypothetical protein DIPPA_12152 [Diplonema papillatum]KAJ9446881.1 hypothetical protein DIPPA_06998 [Diplonema papillatum]